MQHSRMTATREQLLERIAELERELLERANMTPEQVIKLCVRERAEEREQCVSAVKSLIHCGCSSRFQRIVWQCVDAIRALGDER